jgi:SAM-dependent methyltransferase
VGDEAVRRRWDEAVKVWVEKVRSGSDDYREYMNGPAFRGMVGDVGGLRVLDLACGEGYWARFFAGMGAEVVGVDFSGEMIGAAVDEEVREPRGIEYHMADVADLGMFGDGEFDLVYSFMALQDISDFESAIGEAARVLKDGGRFIAIFLHPCFSWARTSGGETVCDWERLVHEDGSKDYLYLKVYDYFRRHQYPIYWRDEGHPEGLPTIQFHRTLSDYVNALGGCGLYVTGMEEPSPVSRGPDLPERMMKLFRIPHSIIVEAKKMT